MSEKTHEEIDAEALRDALKDIEATVTAALAHQPEDEAKCGQFLYDALVKCFNIADLACNAARTESEAAVSRAAATAEKLSEVGNAAKLREVLIDAVERLEAYVGCDHHTFHPTATTCDGITSIGKCGKIGTCAAIFKARDALAAPPRNCDRFKTAAEAWEAYEEWVESYRSKGKTPPFNEFGWLFATAKEGGAK